MNKQTIFDMPTADIDWLIATKLFGWTEITDPEEIELLNTMVASPQKWYLTPEQDRRYYPPNYCSNIGTAWLVVEKLQDLEFFLNTCSGRNGKWEPSSSVDVGKLPDLNGNPSRKIASLHGVDVPEAICRLALVAVLELS